MAGNDRKIPTKKAARKGRAAASGSTNTKTLLEQAIRLHQSGDLFRAEQIYRQILLGNPGHVDALHLLGVLCHQKGESIEGEQLLRKALNKKPHPLFYVHLGNLLTETGRKEEAVLQFQMALRALKQVSPKTHGTINNMQGQNRNALSSQEKQQAISANMSIGLALLNLFISSSVGSSFPGSATGDDLKGLEDAAACFQQVLQLDPGRLDAARNYGIALRHLGRSAEACQLFEQITASYPDDIDAQMNLGSLYWFSGRHSESVECYRKVVEVSPNYEQALGNLAKGLERSQDLDGALEAAERALIINPASEDANYVLAQLDYREKNLDQARMRLESLLESCHKEDLLPNIWSQLGVIYDKLGDADAAFYAFEKANQCVQQLSRGSRFQREAEQEIDRINKIRARLSTKHLTARKEQQSPESRPAPVFLVGFPRSGTTLLDQMLNAHPGIDTVEEQPTLSVFGRDFLERSSDPDSMEKLGDEQIQEYRGAYFDVLGRFSSNQDGCGERGNIIVDKFPLHIRELLLIYRVFPDARIIFALRDPRDVCLSNFMQQYILNSSMYHFLTIENTVRYYAAVMKLFLCYREVLPLALYQVKYEDLVTDPVPVLKELCVFLGVTWKEEMLDYRGKLKQRSIRTPSYQQVARPLYKDAIGRWRRYSRHMHDVLPELEPFVKAFGYEAANG